MLWLNANWGRCRLPALTNKAGNTPYFAAMPKRSRRQKPGICAFGASVETWKCGTAKPVCAFAYAAIFYLRSQKKTGREKGLFFAPLFHLFYCSTAPPFLVRYPCELAGRRSFNRRFTCFAKTEDRRRSRGFLPRSNPAAASSQRIRWARR